MRFLVWVLRAIVFIGLFGLAIKNSGPIDLRLYFDTLWQVPLSLIILAAFATGALIGATVAFATLVRQRREIGRLQGKLRSHGSRIANSSGQM